MPTAEPEPEKSSGQEVDEIHQSFMQFFHEASPQEQAGWCVLRAEAQLRHCREEAETEKVANKSRLKKALDSLRAARVANDEQKKDMALHRGIALRFEKKYLEETFLWEKAEKNAKQEIAALHKLIIAKEEQISALHEMLTREALKKRLKKRLKKSATSGKSIAGAHIAEKATQSGAGCPGEQQDTGAKGGHLGDGCKTICPGALAMIIPTQLAFKTMQEIEEGQPAQWLAWHNEEDTPSDCSDGYGSPAQVHFMHGSCQIYEGATLGQCMDLLRESEEGKPEWIVNISQTLRMAICKYNF